ncbi:MAG: hypothetical protein P8163_13855 [Candidatus Thiodiazotropha sp.]
MRFKPSCFSKLLFGIASLTLLLNSANALDSGYVEAIKSDVEEFTTHEFHPPAESSWLSNKDSSSAQLADLQGFSDYIRTKSPGSYIFYKKLSNDYKSKLHQEYLSTGDLDRVKKDIFNYTREMKRNSRISNHNR